MMGTTLATTTATIDDDDGRTRSNAAAGTPTNAIGVFHPLVPLLLHTLLATPSSRLLPPTTTPTPSSPHPLLHLHRLPSLLAHLLPVRHAAIVSDRAHDAIVQRPYRHVVIRRRSVLA